MIETDSSGRNRMYENTKKKLTTLRSIGFSFHVKFKTKLYFCHLFISFNFHDQIIYPLYGTARYCTVFMPLNCIYKAPSYKHIEI